MEDSQTRHPALTEITNTTFKKRVLRKYGGCKLCDADLCRKTAVLKGIIANRNNKIPCCCSLLVLVEERQEIYALIGRTRCPLVRYYGIRQKHC